MAKFEIELSAAEVKAMSAVTVDLKGYIQNAASVRANASLNEIVQIVVSNCLDAGLSIPSTKEEMIELAFSQEWVKTAAQLEAEAEAAVAAYEASLASAQPTA